MKRVTGIGGIFFKAKDVRLCRLGTSAIWESMSRTGVAQLSLGPTMMASRLAGPPSGPLVRRKVINSRPAPQGFMINYRVEDLDAFEVLREEGCNVLDKSDDSVYGKFAWVIDPEGNKVELWQPPAGQ